MSSLILSEIWIYPVKSLRGLRVNRAKVLNKGLEYDRRWMLVDENGLFMTQRKYPKMALFNVSLENDSLIFLCRQPRQGIDKEAFADLGKSPQGEKIRATIWYDEVDTLEVDPMLSEWFSQHLGMRCRLVSFPETNPRPVYTPDGKITDEQVSLADAYPFLIIGQSSLDDLNARLECPVPMNRFRPNFVFTGGKPFEEDHWKTFRIGKNRFKAMKPCARCLLTTVDQETAEKGTEPLATLSAYRKRDNLVYFGQNLIALDHTEVSVGDKILLD